MRESSARHNVISSLGNPELPVAGEANSPPRGRLYRCRNPKCRVLLHRDANGAANICSRAVYGHYGKVQVTRITYRRPIQYRRRSAVDTGHVARRFPPKPNEPISTPRETQKTTMVSRSDCRGLPWSKCRLSQPLCSIPLSFWQEYVIMLFTQPLPALEPRWTSPVMRIF